MRTSAGILVYRLTEQGPEFLLGHPGGPLWDRRDLCVWSVPKGLVEAEEAPFDAALREFREETGLDVTGDFRPLAPIQQKGGKRVLAWSVYADLDLSDFAPGTFEMEWPPRSGRFDRFPEIDRIAYFAADEAPARILPAQRPFIEEALTTIFSKEIS